MDLQLDGKRVLITGASKGIGFSCAAAFAAEGCGVVMVARDAAKLESAATRIGADRDVVTHAADLSRDEERERLAATFPDIDVLVNNAGAIPRGDLLSISMETWRSAWDLKVFGYVHLTKLYLEQMRARGAGTIVNVIGTGGRTPRADYVCGGAGNSSLIAFTEAVGGESPDFGVRVLGINPGHTATERFLGRPVEGDGPDAAELKKEFPTARVSPPSAIADVVVFLSSAAARGASGVVVDCDQGQIRSGATNPTPVREP